jgi:Transcriptional Coactivator p15 (PC4)
VQVIFQAIESKDLATTVQLGTNRHVRLNEFKGNILVDVREYYESGGETKPGNKGLAMTTAQWNDLASVLPELQVALQP